MEFKKFKKFTYINASKKFCNRFHYICLYYRHTHYGISQRQHVFRVYLIHSNCARLHNLFFFMMDYGENGYLHSKKMSWVEKNRKINNQGADDYSGLESNSLNIKVAITQKSANWFALQIN